MPTTWRGFLNVVVSGDVINSGDNPFRLSHATSRMRLGLEFDAPLTRLQERNIYREALVDYQRARRNYYQFEDSVARDLRSILRQIELNRVNFELRRRALRVAVEQVRLARLELLRPPATEADRLGPTTAINLINALNSLRQAQDAFLAVWIDYEIQRRLLDLAMGTMQLDAERAMDRSWQDWTGVWLPRSDRSDSAGMRPGRDRLGRSVQRRRRVERRRHAGAGRAATGSRRVPPGRPQRHPPPAPSAFATAAGHRPALADSANAAARGKCGVGVAGAAAEARLVTAAAARRCDRVAAARSTSGVAAHSRWSPRLDRGRLRIDAPAMVI